MGIIGTIRKHSWIAVAVVGVAIVAFIIGDLTKNNRGVPDMGKIGGNTVTAQRFEYLMDEAEAAYRRQQGVEQIPSDVEYQLREQVWQNLVDETLMGAQYEKLGLAVTARELSDMYSGRFIHPYIRQMFTDPQTGQFNAQAIRYYTENFDQLDTLARQQWVELEKYVKRDRQQQKYAALVARGFYMPKTLAHQVAEMNARKVNARVVQLSYQSVADEEANPTEQDYQQYYDKHKAEYRVREELRELEFITYPLTPTPADLVAIQREVDSTYAMLAAADKEDIPFLVNSESDRNYDSNYVRASTLPAPMDSAVAKTAEGGLVAPRLIGNQWMMAKVMATAMRPDSMRVSAIFILNQRAGGNITRSDEQAKSLADSVELLLKANRVPFEEAVAQYSDDPQKNDTKGDMDWQVDGGYGFLNERVVEAHVGDVFTVRHPNEVGYLVVKVTDKTPAVKKYRLALITREIVPSEATARTIYNEANAFAGQNRTYDEFTAAAREANLQVRSSMANLMSNRLQGVSNARSIVQWAFNEKTAVGDVAAQVFEADDMYVVVALKDVYKKGYPKLEQVRNMMEPQVRLDKKAEVLMARAAAAKSSCKDIAAAAVKLNAVADTMDSVSFGDYFLGRYGMEPRVQGAVSAAAPNTLAGPVKGASGVYLLQVDAAENGPVSDEDVRAAMEQVYAQKLRYLSQVLKDNTTVVDQRNKFF
ncbi:MAG: peptidyl-prolyl cis-trans isomerase D [bacterium P3]|nr:MAG: peptidyl-prolyl cis-trans isomerase D [bacterium P3]KWW41051.1 MAG: peptidyl-prolyl cis-trans isomerase D [bacterium F083]